MTQAAYDVIVLGAGGVGSAALWQLASRGLRVLGVDRFHPPHDRGSSHGQTRIIRQAYFEHPDYVPLLLESYRLWEELEGLAGERLKVECGLIQVGPDDGVVIPGVLNSAMQRRLDVTLLSAREIEANFPALRVPEPMVGAFEARAGYLHVERCVASCLDAARRGGAELLNGVEVFDWSAGDDLLVNTSAGSFRAEKLIVTAGAWAEQLLAPLEVTLQVRRKAIMWFHCRDATMHVESGFPCFLFELPHGVFYGFPQLDDRGLKAAEHTGGEVVANPLELDRRLAPEDRRPVEEFLQRHLPGVKAPSIDHAVCLYTMSPDEHFIVDRHPDDDRVVFAAGLSGHGYKFAPVLGRALADLATDGSTTAPIDFLSLKRFGPTR